MSHNANAPLPRPVSIRCYGSTSWDIRVKELFSADRFADVTFKFTDDDHNVKTIKAHSLLLSMASPVFDAMFFGDIPPEKDENGFVVNIDDIEIAIFGIILKSLYRTMDTVVIEHIEMAISLHMAADKYMLDDLKKNYVTDVISMINRDNCITALDYGLMIDNKLITAEAKSRIEHNSREALAQLFSKSLPFVRMELLNFIFFQCELNTSEVVIFRALFLWAKAVIACEDQDIKEYVKTVIPPGERVTVRQILDALGLLKAINFYQMTAYDLKYDVFSTDMFSANEMESMLKVQHLPDELTASYTVQRRLSRVPTNRITAIRIPSNTSNSAYVAGAELVCTVTLTSQHDISIVGFSCNDCFFHFYHGEEKVHSNEPIVEWPNNVKHFFLSKTQNVLARVEHKFSFRVQGQRSEAWCIENVRKFQHCGMEYLPELARMNLIARGFWPDFGHGITLLFSAPVSCSYY